MPAVPVYSLHLACIIDFTVAPVYSQLTVVPAQVAIVPVNSWVLVIAVQKLAVVQVNLWVSTVVANRLAIAVVVVSAANFPVVRELGRQLVNFC